MLGPSAVLPAAEPIGLIKGCGESHGPIITVNHNHYRPIGRNSLWTEWRETFNLYHLRQTVSRSCLPMNHLWNCDSWAHLLFIKISGDEVLESGIFKNRKKNSPMFLTYDHICKENTRIMYVPNSSIGTSGRNEQKCLKEFNFLK